MKRLRFLMLLLFVGCSPRLAPGETPLVEDQPSSTSPPVVSEGPTQTSSTAVRKPSPTGTVSPTPSPTSQELPVPEVLLGPEELIPEWGVGSNPVWSPNGKQILFALKVDNQRYYPAVLDLTTGEQIVFEHAMEPPALELIWAPDGRSFAFLGAYETLDGLPAQDVVVGSLDSLRTLRISPRDSEVYWVHKLGGWLDTQTLLYGSYTNQYRLRASGLYVSRINDSGPRLLIWGGMWPAVSTDRQKIAYMEQGQLWITDPEGRLRTAVLDDELVGRFSFPRLSPDDDWIALMDIEEDELYVVARDGSSVTKVVDNVIAPDYAWTPDDRFLLCARGNMLDGDWDLYLVEWRTGRMIQLTEGPGESRYFDLSPDGTKVVFSRHEQGTPWEALYLVNLTQIDLEAPAGESN